MEGEDGKPLVEAAAAGTLETLQWLLATTNADVNAQDDKGDTALHAACAHGHVAVVRWLLDNGARLDGKNKKGDSVLHAAAAGGDVAIMDVLMAAGFEGVDVRNEDERTPAHVAVKAGSIEMLRSLVERGADLRLTAKIRDDDGDDEDGCSFLHVAASVDNVDAIKYLVEEAGVEVDFRNKMDRTALHHAAACGCIDAVKELWAKGAELEAKDKDDRTPLYRAAVTGHRSVVEYLLDEGADLNAIKTYGWTPLHGAAYSGDVDTITLLVDRGAKLTAVAEDGDTVLHVAAQNGKLDAVNYFVDNGLEVDAKNDYQQTPLFLAAWGGHSSMVKLLLDAGADVNISAENGWTPLHSATRSGDMEMIKLLVDRGADWQCKTTDNEGLLFVASKHGSVDAVSYFVDKGLEVDARCEYEYTPLFSAARGGHGSVVKVLLDAGANVSTTCTSFGRLPLHNAAWSGDMETMQLLVERGADVNSLSTAGEPVLHFAVLSGSKEAVQFVLAHARRGDLNGINAADEDGTTTLHFAAQAGDTATIEMLLELGADVHAVCKSSYTVLHYAASAGSVEAINLLIRKGADINAKNEDGESPLQLAISIGNDTMATALLRSGADANAVNEIKGWTTFHYAAHGGSVELLSEFLDKGADKNAVAKDGKTALHLACLEGRSMQAVEYLVEFGIDPNIADENGRTALHCAAEAGRISCISLLLDAGAKATMDTPDKDGYRALHFTAKNHTVQETLALLKAGADVHVLTNNGESPLQLAVFSVSPSSASSKALLVSALCRFGAEWTSACQEKMMHTRAEVETHGVDETDERFEHLEWCMGLRACILHWEQQHREGITVMTKVPVEVIQRGEVSVRSYIADAISSNADGLVYRCKVCVVGPSEWGKSSLVRSIETMKPFLVDAKDRTIGIELVATSLRESDKKPADEGAKAPTNPETNDEAVDRIITDEEKPKHHEVTFWDFAGQDVYQVAHSLFFSRRTVYVLVVDVKAYFDQLEAVKSLRSSAFEAAMDRFLSRYVFRWVRTIFARQPDAEFLVLGTKADLLENEETQTARVWNDLHSRIYQWKVKYMREIEDEYGFVTESSGRLTGRTVSKHPSGRGSTTTSVQELTEKLARLASDEWIVVSITRRSSIDAVRQALRRAIEASERGFPMYTKYSRVLKAITDMRAVIARSGDGQRRIDEGMMMSRPLWETLTRTIPDLEYEECCAILRTLHDLGDVIWYEHKEAGYLRDFVILDPMLIIDVVREVISHEHAKKSGAGVIVENQPSGEEEQPCLDGRVAHSLLKTLPLWKNMDRDMAYAFKMLLHQFQLAYSADDGVMEPESDLIVPSYWKLQLVTAIVNARLPTSAADTSASHRGDAASLTYYHCWEYEVPADLSDSVFEQFAVQSDAASMKRVVRGGCIETSCTEFQSWITLVTDTSKHDVIRIEVASETMDIAWHNMRFFLMKLEKVLDGYSGMAVPRYVVVDGERHSLSPAAKAVRDCIMMNRDVDDLRMKMPWLPPDLEWFINRAWRDITAFQEVQMMHLVRDKLSVLQKLVVTGDSQRRYPALWSLEYKADERVAVLRIMSDLSGRCFHEPIEIKVPPVFLAKHGSKLTEGISLLANVVPNSLSVPILQTAVDAAKSHLEAKTQQATQIHNLIDRLDLSTMDASNRVKKSTESGLSPNGAMAILRDLLKLHNDSLDELSITEICNLECAATSKGEYVWAHPHEIKMLRKELTPCQPQFEADSGSAMSNRSEPHEEPESLSRSGSKLRLSLCIETVSGLTNWDWYKTYCTWELFYGERKAPLAAGATATNADSSVEPSWRSLKSTINAIESLEMLQECRLVVCVKRRSRWGRTKIIGEGQVEFRSLVSVDGKLGFNSVPIRVTLSASGSGSTERVVLCRISN